MNKDIKNKENNTEDISRKEALKKRNYSKLWVLI
jgi:hypothetical protein